MPRKETLSAADVPPPGRVRTVGGWAVANRNGEVRAVSKRCRHQLADLSKGALDKDGCLVCPWHASKYDLDTGRMVEGPRGFLNYQGPTPGYTQLVLSYGRYLRLRLGKVFRSGDQITIE